MLVNTTLDVEMNRIKGSLLLMFLRNLCNHKFMSNKNISWWKCLLSLHKKFFFSIAVSSVPFPSMLLTPLVSLVKVCENQVFGFEFPCKSSSHFLWEKKRLRTLSPTGREPSLLHSLCGQFVMC